jgi:dTDP-4-amino-4,6-dideoxygalactose transaminase
MRVPFLDLPAQQAAIRDELRAALDAVIDGANFVLGPAVDDFERRFAAYLGVHHCVGVNNGTSALHLALLACGIGPGDEVITTPHTWISTSWAISYVGATPVYADIDPTTFNLDPAQVERRITAKTKALLPVHLYGQSADLGALARVAERHGLLLIEDAAQAHGARWQGRRVGSFGRAACFSFYPGKNLGAFGEGGAVVTDDDRLAEHVRRLRDHGQQSRHHHVDLGYNMRMEGVQGAVLAVKLRHLDTWNAARARHARRYHEQLAGTPQLLLPAEGTAGSHVWHLFVVRLPGAARDEVRAGLAAAGVATAIHYPTLVPFQPAYAYLGHRPGDFPVAEAVAASCLSLPMFPELTEAQIDHAAATLRAALSPRAVPVSTRAA